MEKLNLLILISDQHSKFHLGCYGDELVRTPHLDALAARGMVFDNAYCAAPLCVPSRMSFMSCRRPSANRVWTNMHILGSGVPTWAHAMGAAGYETALIGRMHFEGPDQRHGFERRPFGEYRTHPGADWLGAPAFQQIPASTTGQSRVAVELAGSGRTIYQAFDDRAADAACAYLDEQAQGSESGRPFAAVAGFLLPHCPFVAPAELFDYYYERVDVPQPTAREREREPEAIRRFKEARDIDRPLPEERIRVARAAYFGMCEYFDQLVGRVLAKLAETGLDRNTLVVYCSDHGEMAGEHGCWWKSNYYEGSVGVPIIASLPGVVPEGTRSDTICNLMDLGVTGVELAGGEPLPDADGHSLWKTLQGEGEDPSRPDETFSELGGGRDEAPSRMIRRGRWKLYKYHDETPAALFDIEDDPDEMNDLGGDPGHEALRKELLARLYEGWDPAFVREEGECLRRDRDVVAAWGKAVQPRHEDAVEVPDEEDVQLR